MPPESYRGSLRFVSPLTVVFCLCVILSSLTKTMATDEQTNKHSSASGGTLAGSATSSGNLPLFVPVVTYDPAGEALSVAVADVNLDGKPDVVVGTACGEPSSCSVGVRVLLGNGDGTLQPPLSYYSGGADVSVAIADINRDGKPDIVVANRCGDLNCVSEGSVGVLLGNGDGTFHPLVIIYRGFYSSVAIGDFNGDGNPDLAVANWYLGTIGVMLGNGNGTFRSPVFYDTGGGEPWSVVAGDVNRDGKTDLVVANSQSDNLGVLLGNGDGSFQTVITYGSGGGSPFSVAVADVNGDGNPDLVTSNWLDGKVGVLLGNGDGTFHSAVVYDTSGLGAASVAVADVNGDQKPDLLVGNDYTNGVDILLGNGDGTFQPYRSQSVGAVHSLAVADLDGNDKPDLVLAINSVGVMLHVGDIATTTMLTSLPNYSVFGQMVTLTANVQAAPGEPSGSIEFFNNGSALGTATVVNGSGSISVSSLAAGSDPITALYLGSPKFNCSMSAVFNQSVKISTTTTTMRSYPNPAGPGQGVTYGAQVAGQYGGAMTGKVTFWDAGSQIGARTLISNRAVYGTSYPALGSHSITATYSGDSNNSASTSPTLIEHIADTTSTTLTTSESPSMPEQPVTFTARVTSLYGTIPDGEGVTFYDGRAAMTSVPLASGTAAYTTSSLSGERTHYITAKYAGDSTFTPSSHQIVQVVERYSTSTTASASPNPSSYGQAVTWTATVTSTGPIKPTGKVWFDGALGTGTLNGGTATYVQRWLQAGTHAVTAEYIGDAASAPSAATELNQVVYPVSTTTTLTSSPNPSSLGQAVLFTAKVKSSTGASPVGTVTFSAGSTVLGTVTIGNSPTSISISTLPAGSTAVEATFSGVSDFAGSTGTMTQTVNP
jgi:Bacterial Ig-like domain (group 3)/FG-GAP-like repeat